MNNQPAQVARIAAKHGEIDKWWTANNQLGVLFADGRKMYFDIESPPDPQVIDLIDEAIKETAPARAISKKKGPP